MRPVGGQNALAEGEVPGIPNVVDVESQRLRERVAQLSGQALREALRDVRLKRMVGRAADVVDQVYGSVLRADHNEVLRKGRVEQATAWLSGVRCRRERLVVVDEVRETAHVAVGDEAVGGCRSTERLCGRQSALAHNTDSGKVHAVEDLV